MKQLKVMRESLTDREIYEFVSLSKMGATDVPEAVAKLIQAENRKNAEIIKRDKERVIKYKEHMREEIMSIVDTEVRRKDLEAAKKEQEERFSRKISSLHANRAKKAKDRAENMQRRRDQRMSLLKQQIQVSVETRNALVEKLARKTENVDRIKAAIKQRNHEKSLEYQHQCDVVKNRISNHVQEQFRQGVRMLENQERRDAEISYNRDKLRNMWKSKAEGRADEFSKRILKRRDIQAELNEVRETRAKSINEKLIERSRKVEENRRDIRDRMQQRATRANEKTQKILNFADGVKEEKQRVRFEKYTKTHIAKDRFGLRESHLQKCVSNLKVNRSRYGLLFSKNKKRIERRDNWTQEDRIRQMRAIDIRIKSLKSIDDVRKSKQAMMIRNCMDKEKMKRITRKLKNINNKEKFDRIVKRLGLIVSEQHDA
jgi:hypothetical protein